MSFFCPHFFGTKRSLISTHTPTPKPIDTLKAQGIYTDVQLTFVRLNMQSHIYAF